MQSVVKTSHAGPPILRRPHNQLASKAGSRVLTRGYIYGVAPSGAMPTTAAVVIDNKPPVNGYTLPPGTGPILVADTDTYQGQPFFGPWFMNPDTMDGGSPCLVDTTTMSIISIQHGAGQYISSAADTLVGCHLHTGGTDSDGHVQPAPIGRIQQSPNPAPTTAPVISGLSSFTYSDVGKSTFDVTFSFTTDQADPDWLRYVKVIAVRHGQPAPTTPTASQVRIIPNGTGVYTAELLNLGIEDDWDIYAVYVDQAGNDTSAVLIGSTSKPVLAPPSSLAVGTITYTDAGNVTFDAAFTLSADHATTTYEVLIATVRHGGSAPDSDTTIHTRVPSLSSGSYPLKLKSLASNVTNGWDLYVAYKNHNTFTSYVFVTTLSSNPVAITGSMLTQMPSGVVSSGPTITASSVTRTRSTGVLQSMAVAFTETDFTSTVPAWLSAIEILTRVDATTPPVHGRYVDPRDSTTGIYAESMPGLSGTPIDVGFRYVALNGQKSATVWPSGCSNVADPDGVMLSNTDGTMAYLRHNSALRTAVDSSGNVIGLIWDGTHSRTPVSITSTILSAGGIDFSSGLHTNKNLDNIADGFTWLRVQGVASNRITWESHIGDSSNDTTTNIADGANKRFLHTAMSTGVQSALDSSGNLLTVSWGTGTKMGLDGSTSGFSSSGSSSPQALSLTAGQIIRYEGEFELASTPSDFEVVLGNLTNGYGIRWVGTTNLVKIFKYVGGTATAISSTIITAFQDTKLHSFKVTITVGATNTLEGSFDGATPITVTDAALTLTSGTWPFTVGDGNNGTTKLWNFIARSSMPHYTEIHSALRNAITNAGLVKVANSTGTLPRANTDPSITGAIDASSNILANPFGNMSGVKFDVSDFSLIGFSGPVASVQSYTTETAIAVYLDWIPNVTTGTFEVGIGSPTGNGYSLLWTASGSSGLAVLKRYSGGVATTVPSSGTLASSLFPAGTSRIRLCVDFANEQVEAVIEEAGATFAGAQPPIGDSGGPWSSFVGSSVPVWINAASTGGRVQNLQILPRSLFLAESSPVINAIDPSYSSSGHALLADVVDARAISGLLGTGPVSLDSVPDGTTYHRTAAGGLNAGGYPNMTGALGIYPIKGVGDANTLSLDSEIADGTTYARLKASQLNGSTGLLNTPFNSTVADWGSDGSIQNMPGSPCSTTAAYPIQAAFPVTASGWMTPGSTSGVFVFVIGNETNGLGIKWTAAGAVSLVTYKAGTATTGTTIGTITRDSNYHWVSVKLTPGTTPGTTDSYVLFFDKLTVSGSTGTSAITWSSTANVTFDSGMAGGKLLNFRVSSQNP